MNYLPLETCRRRVLLLGYDGTLAPFRVYATKSSPLGRNAASLDPLPSKLERGWSSPVGRRNAWTIAGGVFPLSRVPGACCRKRLTFSGQNVTSFTNGDNYICLTKMI
jgi:hypothetical protein